MALLSVETRKKYFAYLGLGEYNKENIKKLQKKYLRAKDVDGIYGTNTDNLLRHVYNVKKCAPNFKPEEFKCECGGRYCTGYPTYMKQVELKNLQSIRSHYGKPMVVTCGMRCRPYNNSLAGSIPNSKHLSGYATDFYMKGVTDTLANRKSAIKWIKKLPNHNYTYGNGYNSSGYGISAPYMGNALHTDTNAPKVSTTTTTKKATTTKATTAKTTTTAKKTTTTKATTTAKKTTTATTKKATTTVKKTQTVQDKIVAFARKIAADPTWHYVHWKKNDPKTKECPICHNHPVGKYHGTYCTIFPIMCWHHGGGIKCKCGNCLNNGKVDKIYRAKTNAQALKLAQGYLGTKDIQVIRSKSGIAKSALKPGDMCYYYSGGSCQHAFLYTGNGKMIDANSVKDPIAERKAMSCKVAIRYIGK